MFPTIMVKGGGGGHNGSLQGVIESLSLDTNLELCLDAGDSVSYDGSSQTFEDTSGNSVDFYLGTTSGADSSDPTFNGSSGGLSSAEYFSFDGADWFHLVAASNPAWMETLHKNNATFSAVAFVYTGTDAAHTIFSTHATQTTTTGLRWVLNSAGRMTLVVSDGTATIPLVSTTDSGFWNLDAWNMVAISVNEGAGAGGSFHYVNGAYATVGGSNTCNATYNGPSTGNASREMDIGRWQYGSNYFRSGSRLGCIAMWDVTLTKTNMDNIWTEMRDRYGL